MLKHKSKTKYHTIARVAETKDAAVRSVLRWTHKAISPTHPLLDKRWKLSWMVRLYAPGCFFQSPVEKCLQTSWPVKRAFFVSPQKEEVHNWFESSSSNSICSGKTLHKSRQTSLSLSRDCFLHSSKDFFRKTSCPWSEVFFAVAKTFFSFWNLIYNNGFLLADLPYQRQSSLAWRKFYLFWKVATDMGNLGCIPLLLIDLLPIRVFLP